MAIGISADISALVAQNRVHDIQQVHAVLKDEEVGGVLTRKARDPQAQAEQLRVLAVRWTEMATQPTAQGLYKVARHSLVGGEVLVRGHAEPHGESGTWSSRHGTQIVVFHWLWCPQL
ncbi:hypothetical protein GCM10020229_10440 [Kitasatospora albolonga]